MTRQRTVTYSHWSASLANRIPYTMPRELALRERGVLHLAGRPLA